jgi:hypothetical protein
MAFVPEGYLRLKSAIHRLAQARGISLGSARAEIRTELHSGAILAYALEQSTGQMLQIIPELWGTDHGSWWLKSGKCWLPDEDGVRTTRKRFGISFSPLDAKSRAILTP